MVEIGHTVGNYKIIDKLGEGGMGAVFLGEHPVIGRKVALKVIEPRHARNAEVVTRFVNEATVISRIGHEHIVEVTDFGRTPGGDFYFLMEYLEGEPLSAFIARAAPVAPPRAVAIAAQIADALGAAHARGVVHRDLKPENVLLVRKGDDPTFVKVLDFGLAKLVRDHATTYNTGAGIIMGTPYYMSPEQCQGRPELDGRADVYSLGVVLFEMLTGKLPFGGERCGEVLFNQLSLQPPTASSLVPTLPRRLDALLERALAKDPASRFQTMAAFRAELLTSLDERRTTALQRTEAAMVLEPALVTPVREDRGARWVALVAVAALVGVAVAALLPSRASVRASAGEPAASTLTPPVVPTVVPLPPRPKATGGAIFTSDATDLGVTPPSLRVPRAMTLVSNPASSDAAPRADEAAPRVGEPAPRTAREAPARRHRDSAAPPADFDEDGILAPSFLKDEGARRAGRR